MNNGTTILEFPTPQKKEQKKPFNLYDELTSSIKSLNHLRNAKVRIKILKDGAYSIYFHIRKDGNQAYKFFDIYIDPKTKKRLFDKKIKDIGIIQTNLEEEILNATTGYQVNNKKLKADFVQYFEEVALIKENGKIDKSWQNTLKHLKKFNKNKPLLFRNIDEKLMRKFRLYLINKVNANTTHTYFAKIKAALNKAVKDEYIQINPAQSILNPQPGGNRVFLTEKDIQILSNTTCKSIEVKRAFLFICYTGLRIGDLYNLKSENIQEGKLHFVQQKTKRTKLRENIIKLNSIALDIIELQNVKDGYIFNLKYTPNNAIPIIKKWVKDAGINKNVSWHVGRHTFATLHISAKTDLYTISQLLGHSDIRVTQIYTNSVSKDREIAIDNLPTNNVNIE